MSTESSGATLKKTYRRVCEAKRVEHSKALPIYWTHEVSDLSHGDELDRLPLRCLGVVDELIP